MYAKSILAILPFLATIKAVEFNTRIKTELFSPDDLCLTLTSRKVKAGEEVHLVWTIPMPIRNIKNGLDPTAVHNRYDPISIESPEGTRFCVIGGQDGITASDEAVALSLTQFYGQGSVDSQLWSYDNFFHSLKNQAYSETETGKQTGIVQGCMFISDHSEVRPDDLLPLYRAIEYRLCEYYDLSKWQFNLTSPAKASTCEDPLWCGQ